MPGDVILVKGSRAVKMEEIVNFVTQPEGKE
jgi:UDP-N-acetylmuramyl pentapeptide synthase